MAYQQVKHSPITSNDYCSNAHRWRDAAEVIGGLGGTEAAAERLSEPAVKTDLGPHKYSEQLRSRPWSPSIMMRTPWLWIS